MTQHRLHRLAPSPQQGLPEKPAEDVFTPPTNLAAPAAAPLATTPAADAKSPTNDRGQIQMIALRAIILVLIVILVYLLVCNCCCGSSKARRAGTDKAPGAKHRVAFVLRDHIFEPASGKRAARSEEVEVAWLFPEGLALGTPVHYFERRETQGKCQQVYIDALHLDGLQRAASSRRMSQLADLGSMATLEPPSPQPAKKIGSAAAVLGRASSWGVPSSGHLGADWAAPSIDEDASSCFFAKGLIATLSGGMVQVSWSAAIAASSKTGDWEEVPMRPPPGFETDSSFSVLRAMHKTLRPIRDYKIPAPAAACEMLAGLAS